LTTRLILLTEEEYRRREDLITGTEIGEDKRGRVNKRKELYRPGDAWFAPWYHRPGDIHYKTDHANQRPPIVTIVPSGDHWCIDAKSRNGDGWKVTGTPPDYQDLTANPSIQTGNYHGWLKNGEFSDDLEGRKYG
jgi:hypothetical protein